MIKNSHYKKNKIKFDKLSKDPFVLFSSWYEDACADIEKEPNAFVLSTVSSDLKPTSRVVLLKGFSKLGFIFFTNYKSKKGQDISLNKNVCLNFFWNTLERQIRINGEVEKIDKSSSVKYFNSRDQNSRYAAIFSKQSQNLDFSFDFQKHISAKLKQNEIINKPDNWGGYLVKPDYFEFWQGREYRFHDRLVYFKNNNDWSIKRLYP